MRQGERRGGEGKGGEGGEGRGGKGKGGEGRGGEKGWRREGKEKEENKELKDFFALSSLENARFGRRSVANDNFLIHRVHKAPWRPSDEESDICAAVLPTPCLMSAGLANRSPPGVTQC